MKYYVKLPWKEAYIKHLEEVYGCSYNDETENVAISVDDLISIGMVCRQKGFDIIKCFECGKYEQIVDYLDENRCLLKFIEDIRNSSYQLSVNEISREHIEAIVFYLSKHFQKARNYRPVGRHRCTGAYRYWVSFNMKDDPIYFVNIVYRHYVPDKMYDYALRHIHMKNLLAMLTLGEDLIQDFNVDEVINMKEWCSCMPDSIFYFNKWLANMEKIARHYVYDDVNGCETRICVPPEIVLPILLKGAEKIEKLRSFLDSTVPLIAAYNTLPINSMFTQFWHKYAGVVNSYDDLLKWYVNSDKNVSLKSIPHNVSSKKDIRIMDGRRFVIDFQSTLEKFGLKYCHTVRYGNIYNRAVGEPYRRHYRSYIFN